MHGEIVAHYWGQYMEKSVKHFFEFVIQCVFCFFDGLVGNCHGDIMDTISSFGGVVFLIGEGITLFLLFKYCEWRQEIQLFLLFAGGAALTLVFLLIVYLCI